MERAKGFEPSTPTLARLCSTPELHPHPSPGPATKRAAWSPEEWATYAKRGRALQPRRCVRSAASKPATHQLPAGTVRRTMIARPNSPAQIARPGGPSMAAPAKLGTDYVLDALAQ